MHVSFDPFQGDNFTGDQIDQRRGSPRIKQIRIGDADDQPSAIRRPAWVAESPMTELCDQASVGAIQLGYIQS